MSESLYAGAARRVINPPIGTGRIGFRLGTVPNILFTPWEPVPEGDTSTYLGAVEQVLPIEYMDLPSLQDAEGIHNRWQQTLKEYHDGDAQEWQVRVAQKNEQWGRVLVEAVRHGHPTCDLNIQVLRVNDIVIAGMNAEPFFETGLAIKAQSPFKDTFVLGYTNGTVGYLPRAEDYPQGGWKYDSSYALPDMIFQWAPHPVAFRPDAEQHVVGETVRLIRQLSN